MTVALTLFEKIWHRHMIRTNADGEQLLYIDRLLVHEGPFYAFDALEREGSHSGSDHPNPMDPLNYAS